MTNKPLTVGDLRDLINKQVEEHGASVYDRQIILWDDSFGWYKHVVVTEGKFEDFGHGELWLS